MKKIRTFLLCIAVLFAFQGGVLIAANTAVKASSLSEETMVNTEGKKSKKKTGLIQVGVKYRYKLEKGYLRDSWKKIGKDKYYFKSNGYAARATSVFVGKHYYVFDENSHLIRREVPTVLRAGKYLYCVNKYGYATPKGWFTVGNKLYYASTSGKLYTNREVDGVTFKANGEAKNDVAYRLKMKTMSIVNSITNKKMSKSQKLYACWNYVTDGGRWDYSLQFTPTFRKGWQKQSAYELLSSGMGDCYNFACAFAALAREVGYNPYVILGRVSGTRDGAADGLTRHAWVQIDGYDFDPEADFAGWYTGVYWNSSYDIRHTIQNYVRFA